MEFGKILTYLTFGEIIKRKTKQKFKKTQIKMMRELILGNRVTSKKKGPNLRKIVLLENNLYLVSGEKSFRLEIGICPRCTHYIQCVISVKN